MKVVAWSKALTSCANARLSLSVIALILVGALLHYHTQMTTIPPVIFLLQPPTLLKVMFSFVFVQLGSLLLRTIL